MTESPVPIEAPASAAVPTTTRIGPVPSSIVTPRPSASAPGASVTSPLTRIRWPSTDSPSPPVAAARGVGRSPMPETTTVAAVTFSVRRLK